MFGKKSLAVALSLVFLLTVVGMAFAGDRDVDVRDLKGISPHRHRYIFSVIGGGLVGAGLGRIVGGAPDVEKGLLMGAGGMSALYLHSHRSTGGSYRDWLFIGSHTALGTGLGWTICGCNKGALTGGLVGGGGSAIWRAMAPDRGITNASAAPTTASTSSNDSTNASEASDHDRRAQAHPKVVKASTDSSSKDGTR